jgi:plastocyanin
VSARAVLLAAVCAAAVTAAPARGDTVTASAVDYSFMPPKLTVLAGDTVGWRNGSFFNQHTVTSATFNSGPIVPGGGFFRQFNDPGPVLYACTIHPIMTGEVDVYRLLLTGPDKAVARGAATSLTGRVAPGVGTISIEEDTGAGFHAVATARSNAGTFRATVHPTAGGSYRAVSGADASPPVPVQVTDRSEFKLKKSPGRLSVHVDPANPGARVSLQFKLRERFGWWTVARARLDPMSNASFPIHLRRQRRVRARVVLTQSDGWTPLAISEAVRVRRHRRG